MFGAEGPTGGRQGFESYRNVSDFRDLRSSPTRRPYSSWKFVVFQSHKFCCGRRKMKKFGLVTKSIFGALLAIMLYAAPANAQATRTWVSGVGDDANPCSRTAPCKTFAGAISKTLAAGEIDCLDPGGFGALTITKSLTIEADGLIA